MERLYYSHLQPAVSGLQLLTQWMTFDMYCVQVVQVDMMSRTFKARDLQGTQTIRYADVEGQYRAVRMPYKGSSGLTAIFVLPDKSFKNINDAAAKITGASVLNRKNWVSLFDISTLSVSLPRFKVSVSQLDLTKVCVGRSTARQLLYILMSKLCWLVGGNPSAISPVPESRLWPVPDTARHPELSVPVVPRLRWTWCYSIQLCCTAHNAAPSHNCSVRCVFGMSPFHPADPAVAQHRRHCCL
jgi:hypothetical protein